MRCHATPSSIRAACRPPAARHATAPVADVRRLDDIRCQAIPAPVVQQMLHRIAITRHFVAVEPRCRLQLPPGPCSLTVAGAPAEAVLGVWRDRLAAAAHVDPTDLHRIQRAATHPHALSWVQATPWCTPHTQGPAQIQDIAPASVVPALLAFTIAQGRVWQAAHDGVAILDQAVGLYARAAGLTNRLSWSDIDRNAEALVRQHVVPQMTRLLTTAWYGDVGRWAPIRDPLNAVVHDALATHLTTGSVQTLIIDHAHTVALGRPLGEAVLGLALGEIRLVRIGDPFA